MSEWTVTILVAFLMAIVPLSQLISQRQKDRAEAAGHLSDAASDLVDQYRKRNQELKDINAEICKGAKELYYQILDMDEFPVYIPPGVKRKLQRD